MKKLISLFTMGAIMALLIPSAIAFVVIEDNGGIELLSEIEVEESDQYFLYVGYDDAMPDDRMQYQLNDSGEYTTMQQDQTCADPVRGEDGEFIGGGCIYEDTYSKFVPVKIGQNKFEFTYSIGHTVQEGPLAGLPYYIPVSSKTFVINNGGYYIDLHSAMEVESSEYMLEASFTNHMPGSVMHYKMGEEGEWTLADDETELVDGVVHYKENIDLELGENKIYLRQYNEEGEIEITEQMYTVNYDQYGVNITSAETAEGGDYTLEVMADKLYVGNDAENKLMYKLNGGDFMEMTPSQDVDKKYMADLELLSGDNTIYVSHWWYVDDETYVELASDTIVVEGYTAYDVRLLSDEYHAAEGDYPLEVSFAEASNKYQYQVNDSDWMNFSEILILESNPIQLRAESMLSLNTGNNLVGVRQLNSDDMVLVEEYFVIFDDEIIDGPLFSNCEDVFNDVSANDEDCAAMGYVYDLGVFTGTEEGNLEADRAVNRAEAMKIMVEFLDVDMSGYDDTIGDLAFSDISEGAWYNRYLKYGVLDTDPQVIKGYDDGTYRPGDTVNRAEFFKIFVEALGLDTGGYGEIYAEIDSSFPSDKWWSDYAGYLMFNSFFEVDGELNATEGMNRRDIIKMIYKYSVFFGLNGLS